jgi:hypothetical protein
MKLTIKIQRFVSNLFCLLLLAFVPYNAVAQCPKATICDPARGLGLQFDPLPANFNGANTFLDFGVNDTRTGYYQATRYPNDPDPSVKNTLYYNVRCTGGLSNLKITFNDRNHTYCASGNSCYDFVNYQNGTFFKTLLDQKGLKADLTGCKKWEGDCSTTGTIYRKGSVGIGGEPHPMHSLTVFGKILTEQYKVQACGNVWCDYVFDAAYKRLSLEDLEKYIQQNKHLPKTKSADEIKKEEGIDAAETLLNHQEKIEEIFLHLIELDKQLSSSNKQ